VKAKIVIEAGSPQGWHRYVGEFGQIIALDHFGASAPSKILYEKFGLTANRVVEKALEIV
jgi:transketolase